MKHHRWVYAYYVWTAHGDPDKGRWVCTYCRTEYHGDHKPRGSRIYKRIGIRADCEAQMIAQVMES